MFTPASSEGFVPALPGIVRKTLVFGQHTLTTEFRMQAGSTLPQHRHPYEQTGTLVSGRLRLFIDGEIYEASAGASWCIPADALHGAQVLVDSVAIEVFSPVRPDYLPEDRR